MKAHLAILAGLLISTSVSAETIGTYTTMLANSGELTVTLTDDNSTHPSCHGKEVKADTSSMGMTYPLARGCWSVTNSKFISIEMYAYSDGREMAFPIKLDEIRLTEKFAGLFDQFKKSQAAATNETGGARQAPIDYDALAEASSTDTTSAYYAGACDAMRLAEQGAKTAEQKNVAASIRNAIMKAASVEPEFLDEYCDAKNRVYNTAQR